MPCAKIKAPIEVNVTEKYVVRENNEKLCNLLIKVKNCWQCQNLCHSYLLNVAESKGYFNNRCSLLNLKKAFNFFCPLPRKTVVKINQNYCIYCVENQFYLVNLQKLLAKNFKSNN